MGEATTKFTVSVEITLTGPGWVDPNCIDAGELGDELTELLDGRGVVLTTQDPNRPETFRVVEQ